MILPTKLGIAKCIEQGVHIGKWVSTANLITGLLPETGPCYDLIRIIQSRNIKKSSKK